MSRGHGRTQRFVLWYLKHAKRAAPVADIADAWHAYSWFHEFEYMMDGVAREADDFSAWLQYLKKHGDGLSRKVLLYDRQPLATRSEYEAVARAARRLREDGAIQSWWDVFFDFSLLGKADQLELRVSERIGELEPLARHLHASVGRNLQIRTELAVLYERQRALRRWRRSMSSFVEYSFSGRNFEYRDERLRWLIHPDFAGEIRSQARDLGVPSDDLA